MYFKYSLGGKESKLKGKNYTNWNVSFTPDDIIRIKELWKHQKENESINILILLSNGRLADTELLVMDRDELEECIGFATEEKNKVLKIRILNGSTDFYCSVNNTDSIICIKRDFEKFI